MVPTEHAHLPWEAEDTGDDGKVLTEATDHVGRNAESIIQMQSLIEDTADVTRLTKDADDGKMLTETTNRNQHLIEDTAHVHHIIEDNVHVRPLIEDSWQYYRQTLNKSTVRVKYLKSRYIYSFVT